MRSELKITLIYLAIGFLWILVSDRILLFVYGNDKLYALSMFQTAKGLFYVASTAMILYFLIRAHNRTVEQKVRELEQLNCELQAKSETLRAANAEMEQFAFVASHDLQEPLRTISSFLTRLKNQYESKFDEKGKQYFDLVIDGASRMRQIVYDLLNYSLTGKNSNDEEPVSIKETVGDVCRMQQLLIAETGARITTGDLPVIKGGKTAIYQVFQNLIVNAIKYARADVTPEISITSKDCGFYWEISVKDNGIGIDKEYFNKIFIIFQRLHNREQYGGTGMGLTIVKKIIENAGGQIRVQSEPGIGSNFIILLPKN